MNTTLLRRARRHFSSDLVPMHVNRANRLAWVRSLRFLGSRWLLAKPLERKT